jgi:hypothetical protein
VTGPAPWSCAAHARAASRVLCPRFGLTALLVVAAAVLPACGESAKGLIPTRNAGPLQSDFEAVARAAERGNGSCTATEAAIAKTELDFNALPHSVSSGLRSTLRQGIANLRIRALALCTQPLPASTTTTTSPTTVTTKTTPTVTQTTPTPTTPTSTTPTTTEPGGGTPGPEGERGPESESGAGSEGAGASPGAGANSGAGRDAAHTAPGDLG